MLYCVCRGAKRRGDDGRVKEKTIEGFIIKRVSTHDNASLMTRHSVFFLQVGATPKRHVYVLFDAPLFFEVLHSAIISDFGLLFRFFAQVSRAFDNFLPAQSNPPCHAIPSHPSPSTGNLRRPLQDTPQGVILSADPLMGCGLWRRAEFHLVTTTHHHPWIYEAGATRRACSLLPPPCFSWRWPG